MSSFSEGQTHQFMEALRAAGWTKEQVTQLGQHPKLTDLHGLLAGTHQIALISASVLPVNRIHPFSLAGSLPSYSENQTHKLMEALQEAGWTKVQVTQLAQHGGLADLRGWVDGTHQIVLIPVPVLPIDRSHPFSPTDFIGEGWEVNLNHPECQDSLALIEFDLAKVRLEQMLKEGDSDSIVGEVRIARLMARKDLIRADAKIGQILFEDWERNGENSMLEYLRKRRGVTQMNFPGTVLLYYPSGNSYVLCLSCHGSCWKKHSSWLAISWPVDNPSLVFSK